VLNTAENSVCSKCQHGSLACSFVSKQLNFRNEIFGLERAGISVAAARLIEIDSGPFISDPIIMSCTDVALHGCMHVDL
jgi:hypothetical protein